MHAGQQPKHVPEMPAGRPDNILHLLRASLPPNNPPCSPHAPGPAVRCAAKTAKYRPLRQIFYRRRLELPLVLWLQLSSNPACHASSAADTHKQQPRLTLLVVRRTFLSVHLVRVHPSLETSRQSSRGLAASFTEFSKADIAKRHNKTKSEAKKEKQNQTGNNKVPFTHVCILQQFCPGCPG